MELTLRQFANSNFPSESVRVWIYDVKEEYERRYVLEVDGFNALLEHGEYLDWNVGIVHRYLYDGWEIEIWK